MRESWDRRIERANQLAAAGDEAGELLTFYAQLLGCQKELALSISGGRRQPGGLLQQDLTIFRNQLPRFVMAIARGAPAALAIDARQLLNGPPEAIDDRLLEWWQAPSDHDFFPKAALQPYAQWLADTGVSPRDRPLVAGDNRCAFCGGAPQLSILHGSSGLEGGGRLLQCSTCLTTWPYRRVRCAACGEEDELKLGYFHAPSWEHVRIDACDTCRSYLKTIDLTRLGLAVPLVDEVAAASLDVWAAEQGYRKIERNLVGL